MEYNVGEIILKTQTFYNYYFCWTPPTVMVMIPAPTHPCSCCGISGSCF